MSEEVPASADGAATVGSATRIPTATDNQDQSQTATSSTAATNTAQLQHTPQASSSGAVASSSSSAALAGPSGSSSTSLDTIDDVCNAIFAITASAGDPNAQFKLVLQSLLPALQYLEQRGTHLGVPGAVVLSSPLQGNLDPLQVLLTQVPSTGIGLGYLFILVARCYVENADAAYLLPFIVQYIQAADAYQLRLVPHKATALANALSSFLQDQPGDSIAPLLALHNKLQGDSRHHLNAIQPLVLYAALRSGQFSQVIPLLRDQTVTDVDPRNFPVVYQDNLKYHLYGGIILSSVSDYRRALYMLETVVTAPCQHGASSLLQIDAYKHLVLVQLLENGKISSLPKYTSTMLLSTFKQLCNTPYLDFAKAYDTLDTAKIVEIATQQRKVYEQDGTLGLVIRCINMIPARKIIKLSKVYKTVELQDVIRSLKLVKVEADTTGEAVGRVLFNDIEQAKAYVRQVVQALAVGKKLAVVLKPAHEGEDREYLEFLDTSMTQEETALALQRSMDVIRNSYWTVSNLDRSLSSSRAFLSKAYAISGKNPSDGMMDPAFDASNFHPGGFTMEEDLMGEKGAGSEIWDD